MSPRGARSEAPGRSSNKSRTAQLTVTPVSATYTEEGLAKMLSECRLKKEEALLTQRGSQCHTVSIQEQTSDAVGPTLLLQLHIPVEAIVDTGSRSTVISTAVLDEVGKHLHQLGKEMAKLIVPTARLWQGLWT